MRFCFLLLLGLPVLLAQTFVPDDSYDDPNYDPNPAYEQQALVLDPGQSVVPVLDPEEPGPVDCREEQYPCTRLYSVHQPCKQCLNSNCFYSLRRVYVINKEICVRTVCAHDELIKGDLCRDQFSGCPVAALTGHCGSMGGSCGKSCGGC